MRTLIGILTLAATLWSASAATVIYRAAIPFTTNPSASHTVTVNGEVWTFVASSPGANEVEIGATAADTALAYYTAIQADPYDGLYSSISGATVTVFSDTVNEAITASNSGGWGTITVTAEDLTSQYPVVVPLANEPVAVQAPTANGLVNAFALATTVFPASAPALTNFLNNTTAQTIGGAKTFTGANIYSNATQQIVGGTLTNMTGHFGYLFVDTNVTFRGVTYISNNAPTLYWTDANAATDEKHLLISSGNGDYTIQTLNDSFAGATTAFQIRRTGAVLDEIYFGGAIEVAGLVDALRIYSPQIYGVGTNLSLYAVTNAVITNLTAFNATLSNATVSAAGFVTTDFMFHGNSGEFVITNSEPTIRFSEPQADDDEEHWQWTVQSGNMFLNMLNADMSASTTLMQFERIGWESGQVYIYAPLTTSGGMTANSISVTEGLYGELVNVETAASSLMILTNTTTTGVEPVNSVELFSIDGQFRYRHGGSAEDYYVHNDAAEYPGSGSDHTFAGTSYTRLDFGGSSDAIPLTTAGVYTIWCDLSITAGVNANETFAAKFYDAGAAADVDTSERQISNIPGDSKGQLFLQKTFLVTAPTTIHVYVKNASSASGWVESTETKMGYIRHN